jgi:hypothetical protein
MKQMIFMFTFLLDKKIEEICKGLLVCLLYLHGTAQCIIGIKEHMKHELYFFNLYLFFASNFAVFNLK